MTSRISNNNPNNHNHNPSRSQSDVEISFDGDVDRHPDDGHDDDDEFYDRKESKQTEMSLKWFIVISQIDGIDKGDQP